MTSPTPQHCIAHYDEIALKGRNRNIFECMALDHLRRLLNPLGLQEIRKPRGRFLLVFKENLNWNLILENMTQVFGITSFAPVFRSALSIEELQNSFRQTLITSSFKSFGIQVKRPNKRFPLNSQGIKVQIGSLIAQITSAKVDLENPECWVQIEVMEDAIYYSYKSYEGPRGLPIPASGKVMTMLSGGIDSPVAAYQIMRRGCESAFVHFHSSPFTNQASIEKVRKVIERLNTFQGNSHLYLVPFAALQQKIVAYTPAPFRVILYRRAMVRIAEKLAQQEKAQALVTGDNLGQVASQTLQNMACVDKACNMAILRPLISFDKVQIIDLAKKNKSFEISILPDQDCCSFMVPEHPSTRAPLYLLEKAERDFPLQDEIDHCLQQTSLETWGENKTK